MAKNKVQNKKEVPVLSRREFLSLLVPFSFTLGIGAVAKNLGGNENILRPPGAPLEEKFFAQCIQCHQCEEVCHTSAINTVTFKKDILKAGTPELNFREGYCDFCMKCVDACPTGVLQEFDKDSIKLGVAVIDPDSCIAWSWSGCTVCYEVCPESAISLDESKRPVVDPELCNGCGICEYSCPRSLYRSYDLQHNQGISVKPLFNQERK